jgi:membrane protein implicated in regulation of membrane protease activity
MSLKTSVNKLTLKGFNLLDHLEFLIIGIIVLFSAIAFREYFFAAIILIFAFIYNDLSLTSFPEFLLYISLGILIIISAVSIIYSPLILNKIKTKTEKENKITEDLSLLYIDREPWLTMLICMFELIALIIFMSSITFAHVILITFINIAIVSAILFAPIKRPSGFKKYACIVYGFLLPLWVSAVYIISIA